MKHDGRQCEDQLILQPFLQAKTAAAYYDVKLGFEVVSLRRFLLAANHEVLSFRAQSELDRLEATTARAVHAGRKPEAEHAVGCDPRPRTQSALQRPDKLAFRSCREIRKPGQIADFLSPLGRTSALTELETVDFQSIAHRLIIA